MLYPTSRMLLANLLLAAMPLAASTNRIYVLNNQDSTVDVIDPSTNKVVQVIDGIPHSHGIAFSHDGTRAYITSETQDTLYEVDTKAGKILRKVVLSKGSANLPAISRDDSQVFVCINGTRDSEGNMLSQLPGAVDVVEVSSFQLVKTLPMKGGMHDCYTTPDGNYEIASSLGGKFLTVINPKTYQSLWTIDFNKGVTTSAFELNPDGSVRRIFSPLAEFHGFVAIDFATHKEVARITLPDDPSDFRLQGKLVRRNGQPTHGDAITPDGKALWVVSRISNGVFVYSLPELKLLNYIPTETDRRQQHPNDCGDPGWITFTSDGSKAYIADAAIDAVSVIDTKAMKQVAVIPVGAQPDHVETLVLH